MLSKLFRGKFLEQLKAARQRGKLEYHGSLEDLREEQAWQDFLGRLVQKDWVVYSKRLFRRPGRVLKYLARYTHRVAISDQRLQEVTDETVTFSYKDYRDQGKTKSLTLAGEEFLRRFLLHVLPKRFMRIRSYGFLSNAVRAAKLKLIRGWLTPEERVPPVGVQSFLAGLMEGRVGSRRGLKRRRRVRRAFGGSSKAGTVRDGL